MRHPSILASLTLGILLWATNPLFAGNQALTAGIYGATLGAGGATGAERIAFGQNPAALQLGRSDQTQVGIHLNFYQPYRIADLRVAEAAAYYDHKGNGYGLAWRETFIEGFYQEQGFSMSAAFRLGRNWKYFPGQLDLGAAMTGWRVDLQDESPQLNWSQELGAVWRLLPSLKIGAFGSGFTAPIDAIGPFERIWQIGMEAQNLSATQVFRLDFRKTGETPWRSLAALAFTPHPTVRLTLGFASPPFQLSLGLNLAWGGWQGYQSLRYHRYLGRTLLSGMAYSLDLPH